MAIQTMTRRALIPLAAAAAAAAGCRSLPLQASHASAPAVILPVIGVYPVASAAGDLKTIFGPVLASFNSQQRDVRAVLATPDQHFHDDEIAVGPVHMDNGTPRVYRQQSIVPSIDLLPLLRTTNWDADALLPGFAAALQWNGQLTGVPYGTMTAAIGIDAVAWRAAGLALPGPTWAEQDFASACAVLFAASGRKESALWGQFFQFTDPEIWAAWVLGYGGRLVSDGGQIVLSDDGARMGIGALAAAIRAARPDMCATSGAMAFTLGAGDALPPAAGAASALARLPVMPVGPVIPAAVLGLGVPRTYPHPELAAAFLAWLTGPAGQAAMVAAGFPTVRQGGPVAAATWQGGFPAGYDLGGLTAPPAAIRPLPWQVQYLFAVLGTAVWRSVDAVEGSALTALLRTTEQQCNAVLALPVRQQAVAMEPLMAAFKTPTNAPAGEQHCFAPALNLPSTYARAPAAPLASGR